MKSAEQIEQSMRRLNVPPDSERRAQRLRDVIEAHTRQKKERSAVGRRSFRRIIMVHATKRVAAIFALAVVLVGGLSWGTGSVAFSEARHAVNSTLAWLRQAVVGSRPGEPEVEAPRLPVASARDDNSSAIMYAARLFRVSEDETNLWQTLKDQGIEFVAASTDPEVRYAVLSREQGESFDALVTLRCLSAPRVIVRAGGLATLAMTDSRPQNERQGFALGLQPTVSSDGKEVQSTISFHDGHNGFEIPNVSTESGGVVLIYAKGMFPGLQSTGEQDTRSIEVLVRLQVDVR
jgi:hypothetical protein